MKSKLLFLFILLFLTSCTKNSKDSPITFGDVVDLSNLEKVTMRNNSGTFILTTSQLEKLKKELSTMVYEPNIGVKVGSIGFDLYMNGNVHRVLTRTKGNYIEVDRDLITKNSTILVSKAPYYFQTNGVNFDNYKKENK
ncbi:MAG: hypothetical protein AAF617_10170 [Bacteroidota bacterium]